MTDKATIIRQFSQWMSQDEYGWEWTFLYWENVAVNEQNWITLSEYMSERNINQRTSGYPRWLVIGNNSQPISFSRDGYIEWIYQWTQLSYKDSSYYWDGYWPLYKAPSDYYNAVQRWNNIAGIRADKIDRFLLGTWATQWFMGNNLLTNPWLTSDTWWTVGAWWTTGVNWATHTAWVSPLVQSITATWETRINILVTTWTVWTFVLTYNSASLWTTYTTANNDLYITAIITWTGWAADFGILPSNTFNGTVKFVDIRELGSNTKIWEVTLTSSLIHPALYDWLLYVGSGNVVEVVDTTLATWAITQTLQLNTDDTVTWITKIGTSYMIYTNNWQHWRQYFWDWVSTSWTEEIFWRDLPIINVQNDGNQDYVVCGDAYNKSSLWLVAGYSKNMIAQSDYIADGSVESYDYHKIKNKFLFYNPYPWAMEMFRKRLFCPWFSGRNYWVWSKYSVKWLPIVLNYRSIEAVYSSITIGSILYMWYRQKVAIWWIIYNTLWYPDFANYYVSWYVVTNPIFWDTASSIKQLKKLNIWYKWELWHTINIYAQIDDKRYTTFTVSWVTITPSVWSIYGAWTGQDWKIISTSIVAWAWTMTTIFVGTKQKTVGGSMSLDKISGTGDATIGASDSNNYILINSYSPTTYEYGRIALFWPVFVNLTDFHKISFKIELISNSFSHTPIVFDIPYMANIVKDLTYN